MNKAANIRIKTDELGDACTEKTHEYRVFVGKKTGGERLLDILRHRWEVNIETDLKEIGWVWTGIISFGKGT
jgi:hypothetical protein